MNFYENAELVGACTNASVYILWLDQQTEFLGLNFRIKDNDTLLIDI